MQYFLLLLKVINSMCYDIFCRLVDVSNSQTKKYIRVTWTLDFANIACKIYFLSWHFYVQETFLIGPIQYLSSTNGYFSSDINLYLCLLCFQVIRYFRLEQYLYLYSPTIINIILALYRTTRVKPYNMQNMFYQICCLCGARGYFTFYTE